MKNLKKKLEKISVVLVITTLVFTLVCTAKVQASTENMETFFNSKIPGMIVQVNATAESQPNGNINFTLSLKGLTEVYVEHFNLSIFGFMYGKDKILMKNVTDNDFQLDSTSIREYVNNTLKVPQKVWNVAYGEISLTYRAQLGGLELRFPQLTFGFTMTHIENVYLKAIEEQLKNLNSTYRQLNQTFWESFGMSLTEENLAQLNETYWQFKGSQSELDTTRRVVAILAITTVLFVATTLYLVMRKPKERWW